MKFLYSFLLQLSDTSSKTISMSTNRNATEDRVCINYIEIINRWNVNRNLKSILQFQNKSFCTENVLGKFIGIIIKLSIIYNSL